MIRKSSIILLLFLMSCKTFDSVSPAPGIQNIPNIVKALEYLANTGKDKVDKHPKE